jgi:hypothetical protein
VSTEPCVSSDTLGRDTMANQRLHTWEDASMVFMSSIRASISAKSSSRSKAWLKLGEMEEEDAIGFGIQVRLVGAG